jgi:aldose 1-epimerase
MFLPSGEQLEISCGDQHAVVVEVGGGLRAYSAGDRQLIEGYGADEMCPAGKGQILAPWPNRLEDGIYEYAGRSHQLALNEPEQRNAIHGLVRWSSWIVTEHEPSRTTLEHILLPQPGYPYPLALRVEYALSPLGLSVVTTATNLGDATCPYGIGFHPYLTLGGTLIDSLELTAPGREVIHSSPRGLPLNRSAVKGTEYDFRKARVIGPLRLDHAFTGLDRDASGTARVLLRDPGTGDTVSLWMDESYNYLMLFSGDPLPDLDRRSLAVEPMTCAPNAFRTGEGLIHLEPGGSFTSKWGISP